MIRGVENLRVGDLISQRMPFAVPAYQRAYAWEAEEVADFVKDILAVYAERLSDPTKPLRHFFGGLVSVDKFAANTTTGRVFEVVDGQQRLATFVISIAEIIRGLKLLATDARQAQMPDLAQEAEAYGTQTSRDFLNYDEVEGGQLRTRPRLTLSNADRVFFEHLILGHNPAATRDSHRRLERAVANIRRGLIGPILGSPSLSVVDKLQRLLVLRSCITEDLHVIHIVSDDRNEAYRLFAILNDRGRTLSDGDLLRAFSLEMLDGYQSHQAQVEHLWDEVLSATPAEIDGFLRAYYSSCVGERPPRLELYDNFRAHFFPFQPGSMSVSDAVAVTSRVQSLRAEGATFAKLADGEWPYENSAVSAWDRDRLHRLVGVLRHTLCVPLLMSAQLYLDEQAFAELVWLLERFAFRYINIVGAHPGRLAEHYYKHSKAIRDSSTGFTIATLETDLRALAAEDAQDEVFSVSLIAKLDYSQSPQRKLIKHFLTTIEDHLTWFSNGAPGRAQPNKMTSFDLTQVSIEHIYPQNAVVPIAALEPFKHSIGNLTFWAPNDNRSMANVDFQTKKTRYGQSSIKLTSELVKFSDWTAQEVYARRDQLVSWARRLYRI